MLEKSVLKRDLSFWTVFAEICVCCCTCVCSKYQLIEMLAVSPRYSFLKFEMLLSTTNARSVC